MTDPVKPEDEKMLAYLKLLGVPPMKDVDDLKRFMTEYGVKTEPGTTDPKKVDPKPASKTHLSFPKIPIFFGEEGKGEVSFKTWAYEINCLIAEDLYSNDVLLQAVRRSLRGHAADQLRYLGVKPTISEILENFASTYGMVETPESILRKFYACKQAAEETVTNYCIRLEDIYAQALEMKALAESDMLRRVFYRGLTPQLRHLAAFKFETTSDYRTLKKEVRQIENDLGDDKPTDGATKSKSSDKAAKCNSINKKEEQHETKMEKQFDKITSMLEKLNTRMDVFETEKANEAQNLETSTPACQQVRQQRQHSSQPQATSQSQHSDTQAQYQPNFYGGAAQSQMYQPPPQMYQQLPQMYQQPQQYQQGNFYGQQPYYQQPPYRPMGWRGRKHMRGPRGNRARGQGPFIGQGRGNNAYRFQRPNASYTFMPECYACHNRGHIARDCPLN